MSGILANVPDGASTAYRESIPLSAYDKARIQREDNGKFFKRDARELLISSAGSYRTIDDEHLNAYLDGALFRFKRLQALRAFACCAADGYSRFERYTREMRRCNQVICRIRREFVRRERVKAATDPFPHAAPD